MSWLKLNYEGFLRGCPFCEENAAQLHTATSLRVHLIAPPLRYMVICGNCSTQGPSSKELVEAVEGWNSREVEDCDCVCEWTRPFGFVPEAGCLIHDKYP